MGSQQETGNRLSPWAWKGYVGETAGKATWGDRPDSTFLRVSSGLAHEVAGAILAQSDTVTRLDFAVTLRFARPVPGMLRTQYERACARASELGPSVVAGAIVNNRGGATLLLGSRTSQRYGRLYDKGHESNDPHYEGCWRWEVEYKDAAANSCATALRDGTAPGAAALASVQAFFKGRGVEAPWEANHQLAVPGPGKPHTDAERQLLWLRRQVRPVVARLVPLYTAEGISAVLGLLDLEVS